MQQTIVLASPTDFEGFRLAARQCLADGLAPAEVDWVVTSSAQAGLFAAADALPDNPAEILQSKPAQQLAAAADNTIKVSPDFLALCQTVVLHRDPARFGLLYRLLWRTQQESGLRHDPLDVDQIEAQRMAQAVRRDLHKMKAFVRFRTVQDAVFQASPANGLLHVAWFEPGHFIAEAAAPFFIRRFTQMRWAILTPECSLAWDGHSMTTGPGASKADAPPADAGEALWL